MMEGEKFRLKKTGATYEAKLAYLPGSTGVYRNQEQKLTRGSNQAPDKQEDQKFSLDFLVICPK